MISAIGKVMKVHLHRVYVDVTHALAAWMITVNEVRRFWNEQPFDLKLKDYQGNCDLCWKKSLRKKLTILKENPKLADWWNDMEVRYGHSNFEHRQNPSERVNFNRENKSIVELLEMSRQPFIAATDIYWKQDENEIMDAESPCSCMRQEEFELA